MAYLSAPFALAFACRGHVLALLTLPSPPRKKKKAVSDRFTQAAAVGGGGVGTGEAVMEAEHRAIEDLGQKRRLLMAVNESKQKPVRADELCWYGTFVLKRSLG